MTRRAREVARKWITENCICYTDDADLERDVLELERLIDAEVADLVGECERLTEKAEAMTRYMGEDNEKPAKPESMLAVCVEMTLSGPRARAALAGWLDGGDGG